MVRACVIQSGKGISLLSARDVSGVFMASLYYIYCVPSNSLVYLETCQAHCSNSHYYRLQEATKS